MVVLYPTTGTPVWKPIDLLFREFSVHFFSANSHEWIKKKLSVEAIKFCIADREKIILVISCFFLHFAHRGATYQ